MPGYSAECVSGQHKACVEKECRCLCHPIVHNLTRNVGPQFIGSSLACPYCSRPPRPGDQFCREDGERLVSPQKCEACGQIGDKTDRFCGKCGSSFTKVTPAIELTDEEAAMLEAKARTRPSDVEVPPTEVH